MLVVEDEALVANLIAAALAGAWPTVVAATSAAALARLQQGGIGLVLLDCTLPDGVHPALIPAADAAGAPVVLMSGDPGRIAALADRPRPALVKPFKLAELADTVGALLAKEGPAAP